MRGVSKRSFVKAIKSKVILALLLACSALLIAWGLSRMTFDEMLRTVDNITAPSERLRVVNVISRRIGTLDQLQKEQVLSNPERYRKGFKESGQLRQALDTLALLYTEDTVQLVRIRAIKQLLNERDKQFLAYLKVRAGLVSGKSLSDQVKNINDMVSKKARTLDSTVLATEQKTSTTTIYPNEEKSRSFLGKIFGKRRTEQEKPIKIVNEERIKVDTIALSAEDKALERLENSLAYVEAEQRRKSTVFLDKEAELSAANRRLIKKMFDVLREVESEVVRQLALTGGRARLAISTGINVIGLVIVVFVLLMAILLYLILTDITKSGRYRVELEKARDEAEYHSGAKQRFLSNMSHEIRTPLQAIIGYADLMKNGSIAEKKYVDAICQSSEHLLQIVNEVLDYNRIVSDKFTFSNKIFDIAALMEEVVLAMRPQAESKGLDLITDFDLGKLQFVYGDPFRLKQILYNLIGNAVKFTPDGQVTLFSTCKQKGEELHFKFMVQDTGVGMSEKETERVFNEFEQGNLVPHITGTGLGLSIIKALIDQLGGRIYVKSKPGQGSVFTFYLVYHEAEKLDKAQLSATKNKHAFGKTWVVDDDSMILDLFGIIFKRNQVDHQVFTSPSALLMAEWDETVEYVLMDIRMPDIDGVSLCRIFREKVGSRVKIFAITAQVLPSEREALLSGGFDGLIMKPFREWDILSAIALKPTKFLEDKQQHSTDNFASLRAMTFGDGEQIKKILLRFQQDCQDDANEIRSALQELDVNSVSLLVHRVGGRLAQIGIKDLAREFKICELELLADADLTNERSARVAELFERLMVLCHSIS